MSQPRQRKRNITESIFVWIMICSVNLVFTGVLPIPVQAQEKENSDIGSPSKSWLISSALEDEIKDGFSYVFKNLIFGTVLYPSSSTQNPDNNFLEIPRYTIDFEARPDFYLDFRRLHLMAKPRLVIEWERWEDGVRSGDTDSDYDTYFNEWMIRLRLAEGLFTSYGRENIQWGPSYLLSPSNPFFRDNGLSNPKREVPGMDFARANWVPSTDWSVSFLANVDEGRQDFITEDFEPTYAFKLDYTTYRKYISLIASYREDDRGRLGAYAGWTVSDALLLYGEGTLFQGTNALYPVVDPTAPLEIRMDDIKDDDSSLEGILLLGASYTLEAGPTLTSEFLFNSPGYDDDEADLYFDLRQRASDIFFFPEPAHSLARFVLSQTLDPRLRRLRQHYVMLQYQQSQIWNVLSFLFRYTYNLDDDSSQFIPLVEYDIGDHTQIFLVGRQNFGSDDTEFRSLVDYSYSIGLRLTF